MNRDAISASRFKRPIALKRTARQQHQAHGNGHPIRKTIECHSDEFDGYEIIVSFVRPAPGGTWMANVRVRTDGIEWPWRHDFDVEHPTADEARRAGIEIGRAIDRA
ncbi:DUF6566 family protein [Burkholderia sp. ABCPW 11]|uniref:DUF6566 family protein n=1 Tax=Burkholderia sp. ABCPW 11 TaxID=1637859 RepID=UPI0027B9A551|nr:DUF6566 family protein [Burkholderia sp. ABCPW 11]